MVILKSIALGLDCDTIRLLVEISEYQYQTLCKNIFSKLQVGNSFLAKHLYRVQKLSSKFYEFRLVHDNQINETDSPNYIRINNFGQRKTGWLTYSPIKVRMNSIGKLEYINEINQFNKTQKT
ncbi:hypothetical protein N9877_00120 [Flavobacteriaceae bacterium]|nr:hypothetical protein [Flavobacteriaceae bacterium]